MSPPAFLDSVIAAGGSFNDTGTPGAADAGFFIRPPASVVAQFPVATATLD